MLLKGKKVLITGGTGGIGIEIIKRVLEEGASVVADISTHSSGKVTPQEEELNRLAKEKGASLLWKIGDVSNEAQISQTVSDLLQELDGIDILINNAGVTRDSLLFGMSSDHWETVLKTNLTSVFYICKVVARDMAKKRRGSIVNISSIVGVIGNAGQTNYSASKAGLIGFTKALAREVAARGVRANVIAPGFIETKMTDGLNDKIKEGLKSRIPLGRIGTPSEVADGIVYLGSDLSNYVTGHVLMVDGGMGM